MSNQHSGLSGINSAKKPRRQYSDVSETITSSTSDEEDNDDEEERVPHDKVSIRSQRRVVKASRKKHIPNAADSEDERSTEKCKYVGLHFLRNAFPFHPHTDDF